MSLYRLIKWDTYTLNKRSKLRLWKFANAAQISFAERALLTDKNQLLFKQKNEAKVCRSTKSTIVGKAKVISYKDIEEEQANRAAKDATVALKKRSRKRKGIVLLMGAKAKRAWRSEVEVVDNDIAAKGMENYCFVF